MIQSNSSEGQQRQLTKNLQAGIAILKWNCKEALKVQDFKDLTLVNFPITRNTYARVLAFQAMQEKLTKVETILNILNKPLCIKGEVDFVF